MNIIIKSPQILAILAFLNLLVANLAFMSIEFPYKWIFYNFTIYQIQSDWIFSIGYWVLIALFEVVLSVVLFAIKKIKLLELFINIFISAIYGFLVLYHLATTM